MLKPLIAALSLTAIGLTPAIAQDRPVDPRVEEILNKLPSETQINDIMAELPDMNVMMDGMMELAENEDLKAGMGRIGARLENRFEDMEFEREDGRPDFNGVIEEMLSLSTDRELMGDVFSLMFLMTDHMEDVIEEADKK